MVGDDDLRGMKGQAPDVILVKKHYQRKNRARKRNWRLREMRKEPASEAPKRNEVERSQRDYEDFMQELEEDPEMRAKSVQSHNAASFTPFVGPTLFAISLPRLVLMMSGA